MLHFGHHPAGPLPTRCLIEKALVLDQRLEAGPSHRTRRQLGDRALLPGTDTMARLTSRSQAVSRGKGTCQTRNAMVGAAARENLEQLWRYAIVLRNC